MDLKYSEYYCYIALITDSIRPILDLQNPLYLLAVMRLLHRCVIVVMILSRRIIYLCRSTSTSRIIVVVLLGSTNVMIET